MIVRDQSMLIQLYNLAAGLLNTGYSSPGEFFLLPCSPPSQRGGEGDGKRKQFSDLPSCFHFYQAEAELEWGVFGA